MDKFFVENYENRKAMCNDGSAAVYYVRKVSDSAKWFIFLQGGGGCYDEQSCNERWSSGAPKELLMSSKSYGPNLYALGTICDDDCSINPGYCEYNQAFIEYCSSDWWSGNNTKSETIPFYFFGKNIIRSVVEDLISYHGMKNATHVTLSGGSAGGVGAWSNSDSIGDLVHSMIGADVEYSVLSDSGWFLDGKSFESYTCTNNEYCNVQERFEQGMKMWGFVPHEECGKFYEPKGELWRCLVGYSIYPFIKARKFGVFNIFDKWQASQDFDKWIPSVRKLDEKEETWVNDRGVIVYESIVKDEMQSNGGVLGIGCFDHVLSVQKEVYSTEKAMNGQYIYEIIQEFEQGKNPYVVDQCHGVASCNPTCVNK